MKIKLILIILLGVIFCNSCNLSKNRDLKNSQVKSSEALSFQDTLLSIMKLPAKKVDLIGLTVSNNSSLLVELDSHKVEVSKMDFGIPFFIMEKRSFIKHKKRISWYKVVSYNNEHKGWMASNDIIEAPIDLYNKESNDLSSLYYHVGKKCLYGNKKYDASIALFNLLLEKYPNHDIPLKDEYSEGWSKEKGKILGLYGLAGAYKAKNENNKAIKIYQDIINDSLSKKRDILSSYNQILEISLHDNAIEIDIIEFCQEIIRKFPNEQIIRFERNFWLDIKAALTIYNILIEKEDFNRLKIESLKMLDASNNPPVELIATSGLIANDIYSGNYETAISVINDILNKYPDEIRYYFKSPFKYSYCPISSALNIKRKYTNNSDSTIILAKKLKENIKHEALIQYINFRIVQNLDFGAGQKDDVISRYEKLNSMYFHDPFNKGRTIGEQINTRLKYIKSFREEKAIVESTTILKRSLHAPNNEGVTINENLEINILYKDNHLNNIEGNKGYWTKVSLPSGEIGWVFDYYIRTVNSIKLAEKLQYQNQTWSMESANIFRTNYIDANSIKTPEIKEIIHNASSKEVVVVDINKDEVLDILTQRNKKFVAISGKDQKNIWTFTGDYISIPIVTDNSIILIANNNKKTVLYKLNKFDGAIIWEIAIGKIRNSNYPVSPVLINRKIIIGTNKEMLAINYDSGEFIWRKLCGYPIYNTVTTDLENIFYCSRDSSNGNDILYSIKSEDGKLNWKFDFETKSSTGFIKGSTYSNGILYISTPEEYLCAIDTRKGVLKWKNQIIENGTSTDYKPSIKDNKVFYASSRNKICAFDRNNGEMNWEYNYESGFSGSPTIVNETVYVRSYDGYIHALSTGNGQLIWKTKTEISAYGGSFGISVVNGLLFVCSTNNTLYIIGEKELYEYNGM